MPRRHSAGASCLGSIRRTATAAAAAVILGVAAGCAGGTPQDEEQAATQPPAPTGAAATVRGEPTATGSDETRPLAGTAVDCDDPSVEGPASVACDFLGRADPEVCTETSVKFQAIAFGASGPDGVARCRETIGARFGGARTATVGALEEGESSAAVTVTRIADGELDAQRVTFVRLGGRWLIDDLAPTEPLLTEADAASAAAVERIALRWYRELDPAVCDLMTDAMLRFGWEAAGVEGREACRSGIAEAEPLEGVDVETPLVEGRTAFVDVVYGEEGARQFDRIRLVIEGGSWLIDGIAASGFAE